MLGLSRFRAYCFTIGTAACALGTCLGVFGPMPVLEPILVLGVLFAVAENSSVELPNRSSLSASLMLGMAAVVVFSDEAAVLGPLFVGMFGCAYLPQIRNRQWAKVFFNLGNFGLSTAAAALVFAGVPVQVDDSIGLQLLASIAAALTFATVNSLLLVPAVSILTGKGKRAVLQEMWVSDAQILPFAFLGAVLGRLYVDIGALIVPLIVVPIFIARQAFASYLELRAAHEATLSTLVLALESKDRYTAGHVERVANFSHQIGLELGLRPGRLERLRQAALMHDIGKLIVPNQLLNKPGRLTPSEYERIRAHEHVSVELMRRIDFLAPLAPSIAAEQDHEPETPLESRIIHVADAFDAMTSTRSYRRALTQEVAIAELRAKSGTQFDLECAEALIRVIERSGVRYGDGHEESRADFSVPPPVVGTGSAGLGDLEGQDEVRS